MSSRLIYGLIALLCLGTSCATQPKQGPENLAKTPEMHEAAPDYDGIWRYIQGDKRVGRYTSIPWGFNTASYWIEGPDGVILVDLQFLPSATEELIEIAERVTGKSVVLGIILHANPDKFNGTATLQARGIPVITSQQVLDLIPSVHEKRVRAFYDRYEPDYPKAEPQPKSFGSETQVIEAAGLQLTAHVMGAGCSEAHVVLQFEDHLFAGDLLANDVHSWLEIGKTDAWLERVDEMMALNPTYVHPGRGAYGGPEVLVKQKEYLNRVIEIVAASNPTLPLEKEAVNGVIEEVEAAFPDYGFPFFLRIGIPAEYERQAGL